MSHILGRAEWDVMGFLSPYWKQREISNLTVVHFWNFPFNGLRSWVTETAKRETSHGGDYSIMFFWEDRAQNVLTHRYLWDQQTQGKRWMWAGFWMLGWILFKKNFILFIFIYFKFLFTDFRGRERQKETSPTVFHSHVHPACAQTRQNRQPWPIGMMLQPTELPSQGAGFDFGSGSC